MAENPGWPRGYLPSATEWQTAFSAKLDDLIIEYAQPGSGAVLTSPIKCGGWILEPPNPSIVLTIIMPPGTIDKQRFAFVSTQDIASMTLNASPGQNIIVTGAFGLFAHTPVGWIFRQANLTWYRWLA